MSAVVEDRVATAEESPGDPHVGGLRSWIIFSLAIGTVSACTIAMFLPLVPEAIGTFGCVLMLALIFLRMPVALAMIIPSLLGLYALRGSALVESTLATMPYAETATWSLSVIPMFVLMGLLLWKAGLTESIYEAAQRWLGWVPGGLAVGTNLAGAGLASVSGSSVGMTYTLGRIGIPEMLKAGYDKRMAIGAVIVAGLPGQLIPPSIMLVIYAGIAEVPVGPQLMAGIGPGILVAVMFTIMIVALAVLRPAWGGRDARLAARSSVTWKSRFSSLVSIWPLPIVIAVIIWGTLSGTFTATESGAAAALISLVITLWWRRSDRPLQAVAEAAVATISSVGAIFFMLIGVEMLSRMMVLTGITTAFSEWIDSMNLGRISFLLMMLVVYLILGTFLEPLPMLVLTVPILLPTLNNLDISLLWFGAFAVFMGELAVVSPPVGILSFIIYSIAKDPEVNGGQRITLGDVFVAAGWFMPMALIVSLILIFFPGIATTIPELTGGG
ncbi:TRAP transporter large permease [Nocardioides sp. YIM 152315]|uniref:TRAP transporter large permease n=1 Tax=Nocardioides sp. YIM 152315 TaxID=3031760 RepID=UPI0023DA976E|nr:TRAP transporter large permease [Nocardioides sp. YIM 152315]MDF1602230.1 TRAP transporter large permease [Nocardioides sp. YIM 152315]